MECKTLKNPPITEALIEIKFNTNKNVTVSNLEAFADSISDVYPKKESMENQSFELLYSKESGPKHEFNIKPSGFKVTSAQNNRVVICAIDRFVVSFMPPYTPWPDLKDTARDLYNKYLDFAPQTEITRIGLRYINNVHFPLNDEFSFQKYIKTMMPLPKYNGLPDSVSKFESVVIMPFKDIDCSSTIRQVLLDPEKEDGAKWSYLPFVLDIDVYQNITYTDIYADTVWDVLKIMREKKNAVFFGTFTDDALRSYE